jgi:hypothetical protein
MAALRAGPGLALPPVPFERYEINYSAELKFSRSEYPLKRRS